MVRDAGQSELISRIASLFCRDLQAISLENRLRKFSGQA
jgi:hypothetical protein